MKFGRVTEHGEECYEEREYQGTEFPVNVMKKFLIKKNGETLLLLFVAKA